MQEEYMMDDGITIDLLKIIKACWKKLWLILLVAAVLGGGMFAYGKATYVPVYETMITMYANPENREIAANTGFDTLTVTCINVLKTRTTLEGISEAAGLSIPHSRLAGMISAKEIAKTPLFQVTVTGGDPQQITLIANTVAEVLPEKVAIAVSNCNVGVMDPAVVPSSPVGNNIMRNAAIAAILGVVLVCCIIAGKEIYSDWKAAKEKKAA